MGYLQQDEDELEGEEDMVLMSVLPRNSTLPVAEDDVLFSAVVVVGVSALLVVVVLLPVVAAAGFESDSDTPEYFLLELKWKIVH